jgi:hypothetical protein
VVFIGQNYLRLGGKAIKLHCGLIQAGTDKRAPARPQAISLDLPFFTRKVPLDRRSDKKFGALHLVWNPERLTVSGFVLGQNASFL